MSLRELLKTKTVLFDGGMGTFIQKIQTQKYNGQTMGHEVNEMLNIHNPEEILHIHNAYLDAGVDVITTNTFGANSIVLSDYSLENMVKEININAVRLAHKAIKDKMLENKLIALSVGPGSKLPTLNQIEYDKLLDAYLEQISAAYKEGIDIVLIETSQDILQMKAAINATKEVSKDLEFILSFTIERNNRILTGSDVETVVTNIAPYEPTAIGMNCAFGPEDMIDALEELNRFWKGAKYLSPNAGLPKLINGKHTYDLDPKNFSSICNKIIRQFNISIIGGCCGTDDEHIRELHKKVIDIKPVKFDEKPTVAGKISSNFSSIKIKQNPAPTLVGERANATGSKIFRDLLKSDNYNGMAQIAKKQEAFSHVIDINTAYTGRDEVEDSRMLLSIINAELTAPIMIDSTKLTAIEASLKKISGKPIINSINYEDGGERLEQILLLKKRFPAAVVGLTIDEKGMALKKDHKVEVAERIYNRWLEFGYDPQDLIIDFLAFSVASGPEAQDAALQTILAIKEFTTKHPEVGTTLGVSNISFGLSGKGREILNSVFLNEAVKAGLSTAIVNSEKILPIESIDKEAVNVCMDIIYVKPNAIENFISYFDGYKEPEISNVILPPKELIKQKIITGDKTQLKPIIEELLSIKSAHEILNDILLPTMQEIGDRFEIGKMLLPFVLKSAEVMRDCSDILAPYLQQKETKKKGTVILATVKGDVHDIGKNLVAIVLKGSGFDIVDLGTKVEVAQIIEAIKTYNPVAVGMSGLLVRSAEIIKDNLEIFREKGLTETKILIGGAAISLEYIATTCSPIIPDRIYYCKDVFDDVNAIEGKLSPATLPEEKEIKSNKIKDLNIRNLKIQVKSDFLGVSEVLNPTFDEIRSFIRVKSLKSKLGIEEDFIDIDDKYKSTKTIENMIDRLKKEDVISFKAVYGYFNVKCNGNILTVQDSEIGDITLPEFPYFGQKTLADLYQVKNSIIPLQLVTVGRKSTDFINSLYKNGEYGDYFLYHTLLTEIAETLANYTNSLVNKGLTLTDDTGNNIEVKTKRYSFGYPFCPNLDGNIAINKLLRGERAEVSISEEKQMEPVYSTCAFVAWHPDSSY